MIREVRVTSLDNIQASRVLMLLTAKHRGGAQHPGKLCFTTLSGAHGMWLDWDFQSRTWTFRVRRNARSSFIDFALIWLKRLEDMGIKSVISIQWDGIDDHFTVTDRNFRNLLEKSLCYVITNKPGEHQIEFLTALQCTDMSEADINQLFSIRFVSQP